MATAKGRAEVEETWKAYRSHTQKNVLWNFLEMIQRDGPTRMGDFKPLFDESSDHPFVLDQLKQLALYTEVDPAALPSGLEHLARMPSWLSLMTSFTPRRPRRFRLLRNSVQNGSATPPSK